MHKNKVFYTLGQSSSLSGCFDVKALTKRRLFLKICAKVYDLQKEKQQPVYISRVEVLK